MVAFLLPRLKVVSLNLLVFVNPYVQPPKVDGIYFKNIDIKTVGGNAVYLCGLPERHFKNVFLENVKAHGRYGIKHKNIDNLKLINVDITAEEE